MWREVNGSSLCPACPGRVARCPAAASWGDLGPPAREISDPIVPSRPVDDAPLRRMPDQDLRPGHRAEGHPVHLEHARRVVVLEPLAGVKVERRGSGIPRPLKPARPAAGDTGSCRWMLARSLRWGPPRPGGVPGGSVAVAAEAEVDVCGFSPCRGSCESRKGRMMPGESTRASRIGAGIAPEALRIVEHAAELQGRSVSDSVDVVVAAQEAARKTMEESHLIRLSVEDQHRFAEILLHPPGPSPSLQAAKAAPRRLVWESR